ncbi:MAG: hypothetical protein ACTSY1_02340 [Alphaproteobacteria bacterium]
MSSKHPEIDIAPHQSTTIVERSAAGGWVAWGDYLGSSFMAACGDRASTLTKAAELREAIFIASATPPHLAPRSITIAELLNQ